MRPSLSIRMLTTLALFSLFLTLFPAGAVDAQAAKKTVLVKVTVAAQNNGGWITLVAGGGTAADGTVLPENQKKVTVQWKSKTVTSLDKVALSYTCKDPADPENADKWKTKWKQTNVGNIPVPGKLSLSLPKDRDSSNCLVVSGVDAPYTGERPGKIALTLKTIRR